MTLRRVFEGFRFTVDRKTGTLRAAAGKICAPVQRVKGTYE